MSEDFYGIDGVEDPVKKYETDLTIEDVLPKTGKHLALDVSTTNTGIALWDNGELTWWNSVIETDKQSLHGEALMRRELRSDLESLFSGHHFDTILIEDVFIGINPTGVRYLFALNTVIDDLILDEVITVGDFHRVNNNAWKKWLKISDPSNSIKGWNDKQTIRMLLKNLGVESHGKGDQDRLDATGLLVGYYLKEGIAEDNLDFRDTSKPGKKIPLKEIQVAYESTKELIEEAIPTGHSVEEFLGRVSEKSIRETVTNNPEVVWLTKKQVSLGVIVDKVGVEPIPFGGYVAFWSKQHVR